MSYPIRLVVVASLSLAAAAWTGSVCGQIVPQEDPTTQEEPDASPEPQPQPRPNAALVLQQQQVADQFKHLEEVLLRMAEVSAPSDPRRAALLRQAVAQSKQRLIDVQFETLVTLLNNDQLSSAIESQQKVNQDLRTLLELLLSEDRGRRIESEKARVRDYLKRLEGLLKQQKLLQGRTAADADLKSLAKSQADLAQQAGGLAEVIKNNEEAGKDPAQQPDKTPPTKPKEPKEPPTPGQQQGTPAAQPPDRDQQSPPQANQGHPARRRLEAAQQRMREAQQKLEQAQREGAAQKQEEAIRELEQAKAELEEILRQLREEEIGRMLTLLEARFRKMLQLQREVYDGTVRLDKVPLADRTHSHDIEAGRLGSRESEIVFEADKALSLMREDGTAVAFPEAAVQVRDDMQQVVQRLAQSKVDRMTQGIEEDILAALEEMIGALEKAQKDLDDKKQQTQSDQGDPQNPPLVDMLSELKMVRALQMRVNSRTQRYSKLIEGQQATGPDMLDALKRLAERQERIFRVTHDLERGRNQ